MYPKQISFRKLEAFALLIEKENFSEVAALLGCTQPAVSQLIKGLEDDFDLPLFDRYSSFIRPTPAGSFVYQKAKAILKQLEELEDDIQVFYKTLTGNIVIGASTIPGSYLVPRYVNQFRQLFPNVNVSVDISDSEKTIAKIMNNQVDVGIIGSKPASDKIISIEVGSDTIVFITPNGHPLSYADSVNGEMLRGYSFVLREQGSGTRKAMEEYLMNNDVQMSRLRSVVHVGSTEAVIASVETGMGISCVSMLAATPATKSGRIQIVEKLEPFKRNFYLATLAKNKNQPIIKELLAIFSIKAQNQIEI